MSKVQFKWVPSSNHYIQVQSKWDQFGHHSIINLYYVQSLIKISPILRSLHSDSIQVSSIRTVFDHDVQNSFKWVPSISSNHYIQVQSKLNEFNSNIIRSLPYPNSNSNEPDHPIMIARWPCSASEGALVDGFAHTDLIIKLKCNNKVLGSLIPTW
jgi:hypothetical protein